MRTFYRLLAPLLLLALLLPACATQAPQAAALPSAVPPTATTLAAAQDTAVPTPTPAASTQPVVTSVATRAATRAASAIPATPTRAIAIAPAAPTTRPTLGADDWKALPVVPEVSNNVRAIFAQGQKMGNNPRAFSKVGDCGSTPAWFLGDFDRGPKFYSLGEHTELQGVIDYYAGSFDRTSLAARSGFNASALFTTLWADRSVCSAAEAPLPCEYRDQRPALAFIMLGTNDIWRPAEFEPQMRKIIEYSLAGGVIPILSTKADNQEKDHFINATIARLAFEYDIPLWNYWAAVSTLPDGGLQEDGAHLTFGRNFFDDPEAMTNGWPIRNLTALQVLHAVWSKLNP